MFRNSRSACCSCLVACLIAIGAAYVIVPPLLKTHPPEQPLPVGLASGILLLHNWDGFPALELASGRLQYLHTTQFLLSPQGDWALCKPRPLVRSSSGRWRFSELGGGHAVLDKRGVRGVPPLPPRQRPPWFGEIYLGRFDNFVSPADDGLAALGVSPEGLVWLDVRCARLSRRGGVGTSDWCLGPARDEVCRALRGSIQVVNTVTGGVRKVGRGSHPAVSAKGDIAFVSNRGKFAIVAADGFRRAIGRPKVHISALRWSPDSRFLLYLYRPLAYLGMPNLAESYAVGVIDTRDGRNYRVIPGTYGGQEVREFSCGSWAPPQWVERVDPQVLKVLQREAPDFDTLMKRKNSRP